MGRGTDMLRDGDSRFLSYEVKPGSHITAGHAAHSASPRGPSPVTVVVGKALYAVTASGRHLPVPPAAREALTDTLLVRPCEEGIRCSRPALV
jgi:hypothetical protein